MTKKHFVLLAKAFREERPGYGEPGFVERVKQWRRDIRAIVGVAKRANPRFDGGKFLEACEYEEKMVDQCLKEPVEKPQVDPL